MSVRQLCRDEGIANHSVAHEHAAKRDRDGKTWYDKRAEFEGRTEEKFLETLADRQAARLAKEIRVEEKMLDAISEAADSFRAALAERTVNEKGAEVPVYRVTAADLARLIDRLNVLRGRPAMITEERSLGVSLSGENIENEVLKEFLEATRDSAGALAGATSGSPLPRAPAHRAN